MIQFEPTEITYKVWGIDEAGYWVRSYRSLDELTKALEVIPLEHIENITVTETSNARIDMRTLEKLAKIEGGVVGSIALLVGGLHEGIEK